jgi:flagellar motor protein MotB
MSNPNDDLLTGSSVDKVEEYFKLKGVVRTLRNDLKDYKIQHPDNQELEKVNKKVKELREKIKEDETIKELNEKISVTKERVELVKELIRLELLENSQEEVKKNGRKLKLIYILKELKDEEEKKKRFIPRK